MKTPVKVLKVNETEKRKVKNVKDLTKKERVEVRRLFKKTGLTKPKLIKMYLMKEFQDADDNVVTLMKIFALSPETVKLTSESKFNTKQPQEQIKVYEVKDEEINLKSENGVERMDEADGQEHPAPGFFKRTVSKLWNGVPRRSHLAGINTFPETPSRTVKTETSLGCIIC